VVLALALIYAEYSSNVHVVGALRGMGAVAAGLITATGLKLVPALKKNVMGVPVAAVLGVLAFVTIAWLKLPLAWVLIALGGFGCVYAYRKLA
jgi:chromate transporter